MPSISAHAKEIYDEGLNAQSSWVLICSRHPQRDTETSLVTAAQSGRSWALSRRGFPVAECLLLYVVSTDGINRLTRVRYLNHEIS